MQQCSCCSNQGENLFEYQGKFYCPECVERLFTECYNCGERTLRSEGFDVSGNIWCPRCTEETALYCQDCGHYFDSDEDYQVINGYYVCESCISNHYSYCERCGHTVHDEDYDFDNECCYRCADNSHIGAYHSTKIKFIGEAKPQWRDKWRGLGIELEIDRGSRNCEDENNLINELESISDKHIYFEHDGSLDYGFEIITHPHTEEEFFKVPWQKILQLCKDYNYRSHDAGTCGLHIHFSRNMLGATKQSQDRAIAKLMYFFEKNWRDILVLSRRTESQANSWAYKYAIQTPKEARENSKKRNLGRYFAINNSNLNTLEIRIGRGTLRYETFMAWIDFCLVLIKNSRRVRWDKVLDTDEWLKGIKEETRAYIKEKNAFTKGE